MIMAKYRGVIERYRQFLPVSDKTPQVSLSEGNTPLIFSQFLTSCVGSGFEVFLKFEGLNPTGSFKDRGMTVAISKAKEEGKTAVICASTGNTSASASAYAAKAEMRSIVLIPKGAIALGKLSQALIHGAKVLAVNANFDRCLELVREISANYPIQLVNSINPYRIEGQKTAAFEISEFLGDAPDYQLIPVGNAGNITAYWKGYKEFFNLGKITHLPKMLGFQAEGAAPIVKGRIIKNPRTIASAIKIGNPANWKQAQVARDESGGLIDALSDAEIIKAYKALAEKDGVFVEPASAASVAGLLKLVSEGYFKRANAPTRQRPIRIACILTGHGLKDPNRAIKIVKPSKTVKADLKTILKEIGY